MIIKDQKIKRLKLTLKKELEKFIANEREKVEPEVELLKLRNILFNHQSNYEEEIKEKIIIEGSDNIKRFNATLKETYVKEEKEIDGSPAKMIRCHLPTIQDVICNEQKLRHKKKRLTIVIGEKSTFHHKSHKQEVLI